MAYAILAPNAHNMQPWQARLDGNDTLMLYADTTRLLPATDPPARQSTIGFGAFLELLRQAAAEGGFALTVEPFPDGEPYPVLDSRPVARVRFTLNDAIDRDPLFPWLLERHTQRQPFDTTRAVPAVALDAVRAAAGTGVDTGATADAGTVAALRELVADAWRVEWETTAARAETVAVTRIGKAEVAARPWGITLDGPLMSLLGTIGLVSREAMDTPGTPSFNEGMASYLAACRSSMAFVWATTATNTRGDQLRAGAAWVRMHQAATRAGLAFHPLSQALQEFPAMATHYADIHRRLAAPGHTVQMLARLGYGPAASAAPREPLHSKLLRA